MKKNLGLLLLLLVGATMVTVGVLWLIDSLDALAEEPAVATTATPSSPTTVPSSNDGGAEDMPPPSVEDVPSPPATEPRLTGRATLPRPQKINLDFSRASASRIETANGRIEISGTNVPYDFGTPPTETADQGTDTSVTLPPPTAIQTDISACRDDQVEWRLLPDGRVRIVATDSCMVVTRYE